MLANLLACKRLLGLKMAGNELEINDLATGASLVPRRNTDKGWNDDDDRKIAMAGWNEGISSDRQKKFSGDRRAKGLCCDDHERDDIIAVSGVDLDRLTTAGTSFCETWENMIEQSWILKSAVGVVQGGTRATPQREKKVMFKLCTVPSYSCGLPSSRRHQWLSW